MIWPLNQVLVLNSWSHPPIQDSRMTPNFDLIFILKQECVQSLIAPFHVTQLNTG